eukprot:CAMPEP_0185841474 /NCGR_PEP_ID=MMETSP1353-20130828/17911_1 /TAXON_ID=1077150 /ORGANISM="Erythrolobus australicus, Strain CCMP3124" /LENGTH=233 /DNA_ID=CAMNT_0028540949 /DNA_START=166 /DNA_END=867 /DNA_ORIENTATION=+
MSEARDGSGGLQKAPAAAPILCSQGCGFYGSPVTLNMCSMCFRKQQKTPSPEDAAAVTAESGALSAKAAEDIGMDAGKLAKEKALEAAGKSAAQEAPSGTSDAAPAVAANQAPSVSEEAATTTHVDGDAAEEASADRDACGSAPVTASAAVAASPGGDEDQGPRRKVQKNKGRCFECRKKVGLTGFACRCGYVYCGEHRFADQHACSFDYHAHAKELLSKANPVVVAAKVEKI